MHFWLILDFQPTHTLIDVFNTIFLQNQHITNYQSKVLQKNCWLLSFLFICRLRIDKKILFSYKSFTHLSNCVNTLKIFFLLCFSFSSSSIFAIGYKYIINQVFLCWLLYIYIFSDVMNFKIINNIFFFLGVRKGWHFSSRCVLKNRLFFILEIYQLSVSCNLL